MSRDGDVEAEGVTEDLGGRVGQDADATAEAAMLVAQDERSVEGAGSHEAAPGDRASFHLEEVREVGSEVELEADLFGLVAEVVDPDAFPELAVHGPLPDHEEAGRGGVSHDGHGAQGVGSGLVVGDEARRVAVDAELDAAQEAGVRGVVALHAPRTDVAVGAAHDEARARHERDVVAGSGGRGRRSLARGERRARVRHFRGPGSGCCAGVSREA